MKLLWNEEVEFPVGGCGCISSLKLLLPLGIIEPGLPVFQKLEVTHGRAAVNAGSSIGVLHRDEDELGMAGSFVEDGSRVPVADADTIGMNIDHDGVPQCRGVIVGI